MSIGKRLSEERRKAGFTRQNQLGNEIDVSFTTISRWEKEESPIPSDKLLLMADLGLDINYILQGRAANVSSFENKKTNNNNDLKKQTANVSSFEISPGTTIDINDYAWIPLYNVEVSAGEGRFTDTENILTHLSLSKYSLRKHGLTDFEQLGYVMVHGDSMHDTLRPDDCILINFAKRNPDGGIFVLRVGDIFHVKRLIAEKDHIKVISDNLIYDAWTLTSDDDFEIIGKYEWHGRYAK